MTRVYQPAGGAGSGLHADLTDVSANQHHAQSHTLTSHSTRAHAELTDIGATDHHSNANDHVNTLIAHAVVSAFHTLAGGTAGFVLRAIDATSFAWARLSHSDLTIDSSHTHASTTGQTANDHHAQAHHAAHEPAGGDPMAVDAAAATGSLRTLGTGATQAAVGTHVTPAMTATLAGHVPVPPNDATKYLDGTGVFSVPPGGGGPHAPTHQADGNDSLYVEMSPDSNVTVPTDYGFVVVGPYNIAAAVTVTLQGTARMVVL